MTATIVVQPVVSKLFSGPVSVGASYKPGSVESNHFESDLAVLGVATLIGVEVSACSLLL